MTAPSADFILIVDDNPNNLAVLSHTLKEAGYAVRIAVDGEGALQQMSQGLPSLILLDVMMPGIDGFETCRRLKENPDTFEIPVIFMTALTDSDSKTQGLSLGAVDYITKPFHESEVIARIRIHLQLRNLVQTLQGQNQRLKQEIEQRQSAEHSLQQMNHELEERVAARTSQLQKMQLEQVQSEKMAALGNLIAGIAHEVNNPIGFLNGSLSNAQTYLSELASHLSLYQQHYPQPVAPVQKNAKDIDIDFVLEDFPKLLEAMGMANQRIKSISDSLRIFSRADAEHTVSADIHKGLDSTLLILKYRLKANEHRPDIKIVKNYGELPNVDCFPGQLNQVFMNIFANAIDAFDEDSENRSFDELAQSPQIITIKTSLWSDAENSDTENPDAKGIEISIHDNGKGMSNDVKDRIFDSLFTTKEVGKGTGLGLAIAKQIITETHCGQLNVRSALDQGTTFHIRIPTHVTK